MKLVADQGNTACKYYFFDQKRLMGIYYGEGSRQQSHLDHVLRYHGPFQGAILSSVTAEEPGIEASLVSEMPLLRFVPGQTPVPLAIRYKTPATLGPDRLAAAVGGQYIFPGHSVLTIDAGTCIKYDIVTEGAYLGGIISPGINMQARAMHTFTGKLPLVQPNPEELPVLTGEDTLTSMLSGIINTTLASMDGIIARYLESFPELKIVLTGGQWQYFDKRLKYSIFAHPNLVGVGLNEILDFNEDKV
ncbi:MAG TPA: type III pantothenate kinase [Bacteroidales bacterium]|nr:type III pantothenate kinase [Bacteroidales bacterium]HRZ48753.1 type III pantothenate kinase [Bacteroidales bacterium]